MIWFDLRFLGWAHVFGFDEGFIEHIIKNRSGGRVE